jgi:egghead protein (zeste-white 4 protein)
MQNIFAPTSDDRWALDTFGVDQLTSVDDGSWDTPAVPKRAKVGTASLPTNLARPRRAKVETASWATNPARPKRAREEAGSWDTATVRETTRLRAVSPATSQPRRPPSAAVEEPVRDWSFMGSLTVHRVLVIFYVWFAMLALYFVQTTAWDSGSIAVADSTLERLWQSGSLLWLVAIPSVVPGLVGLMSFRYDNQLDSAGRISNLVCLRIVSRGTNTEALIKTINRARLELAKNPLFAYVIEVVTDISNTALPPASADLRYIVVPVNYQTSKGSKYKARALHYALVHSPLPDDAWLVHLDEETHLTSSGVKGIAKMIGEEEASGQHRIGQGAITYHRNWKKHPILTLAESVRTGDDMARFYLQQRLGVTIFGLHGSYIVVRNDVEKRVGFNFGPEGSITEDAFWALCCMADGARARWVHGYLEEQSTQSVMDFVKQRRRWFQGLVKVALQAPVPVKWRITIGLNTCVWALLPFAGIYTIAHMLISFQTDPTTQFLGNLCFATYIAIYLIGLRANLLEHGILSLLQRIGWHIVQILLIPVFAVMEAVGVMSAFGGGSTGFHVVKK